MARSCFDFMNRNTWPKKVSATSARKKNEQNRYMRKQGAIRRQKLYPILTLKLDQNQPACARFYASLTCKQWNDWIYFHL